MPVYKDQKRGTWFVRISSSDPATGKRREIWKRGFPTKREAVAWEADQRATRQEPIRERMTFSELFDIYAASHGSERTQRKKKGRMLRHVSFMDTRIDRITKRVVLDWYLDLIKSDELMVSTKNLMIGDVRAVVRFGAEFYGMADSSPALKKLRVRAENAPPAVWSVDELRRFLASVEDPDLRLFFDFLYWTGVRRGEALGIRISDIDRERQTVRIWHQWIAGDGFGPLKTDASERVLNICGPLWARLEPVLEARDESRPFLFGGEKPLSLNVIRHQMEVGIASAGVRRIRIHDLRHSFATNAICSGANIVAVSKYLGHASVTQTLSTYTHLLRETDDELLRIMSSLDG